MRINQNFMQEDFIIDVIDGISIIKFNSIRTTINEVTSLKQLLVSLVTANHYKLVFDFSETLYLDSAIASIMITFVKEIRKMNGDILAVTSHETINNFFVKSRLNKIFKQFDSKDKALLSFAAV
jgi:anti-sigma B factor antagonist